MSVALIYASAYGNTLAQALARASPRQAWNQLTANLLRQMKFKQPWKNVMDLSSALRLGHMPTSATTALGIVLSTAAKKQVSRRVLMAGVEKRLMRLKANYRMQAIALALIDSGQVQTLMLLSTVQRSGLILLRL